MQITHEQLRGWIAEMRQEGPMHSLERRSHQKRLNELEDMLSWHPDDLPLEDEVT